MPPIFGPDGLLQRVVGSFRDRGHEAPAAVQHAQPPAISLEPLAMRSATASHLVLGWHAPIAQLLTMREEIQSLLREQSAFLESHPAPSEGTDRSQGPVRIRLAERVAARTQMEYLQALLARLDATIESRNSPSPDRDRLAALSDELEFHAHRSLVAEAHRDHVIASLSSEGHAAADGAEALDGAIFRLELSGLRRARDAAQRALVAMHENDQLAHATPAENARVLARAQQHLSVLRMADILLMHHAGGRSAALPAGSSPLAFMESVARECAVRDTLLTVEPQARRFVSYITQLEVGFEVPAHMLPEDASAADLLVTRLQPVAAALGGALQLYSHSLAAFFPTGQPSLLRSELDARQAGRHADVSPNVHDVLRQALHDFAGRFHQGDALLRAAERPFREAVEQVRTDDRLVTEHEPLVEPVVNRVNFLAQRLLFHPDAVQWPVAEFDTLLAMESPARFFALAAGRYRHMIEDADTPEARRQTAVAQALGPDASLIYFGQRDLF